MFRKRTRSLLIGIVNVSGWLYGALIIVYLLGRLSFGEQWTLIEIGNSLMPALLFPTFIFLALAALMKRWRFALLHAPSLCLFAIWYVPFFLPNPAPILENTAHLRLLTFNLGSRIEDEARMVSLIRSADAEIVAVQELFAPSAQVLIAELTTRYPYQALHPADTFAGGVGIFSLYPIVEDVYLDQLSLGGQRTRIAFNDDSEFTILNVHPTSPRILGGFDSSLRATEIDQLLEIARLEVQPVLLIGDFNVTDQTDDYRSIRQHYGDAFQSAGIGLGLSFPNLARFSRPLGLFPALIRIDYVFYSRHWTAVDAHILPDHGGSDHYPLYAEMALEESD